MGRAISRKDWSLSTMCWYAVFIWFGASLFSQTLYLALNGEPYDANQLLKSAGPFAWIMIAIEVIVWGLLAFAISGKVANRIQVSTPEISSSDQIAPQT